MLGVVEHRTSQPSGASPAVNAAIGPLPCPVTTRGSPSTVTSAVTHTVSSTVDDSCRSSRIGPGVRYSVEKIDHSWSGATSPPSESVTRCTTWENSICSRRGRSSACSVFIRYATPPLPDCELTRMTAS